MIDQEIYYSLPFDRFLWHELHLYCDSNMAHFASLLFSKDGLVISNYKGLTLEMS